MIHQEEQASNAELNASAPSLTGIWCVVQASATGSSHQAVGLCLQDAHQTRIVVGPEGDPRLIAVVSDGAGSSAYADEGASRACQFFCDKLAFAAESRSGAGAFAADHVKSWIIEFQTQIAGLAAERGSTPREFAGTLVAALLCEDFAIFIQVGDGVIVVADEDIDDFAWVFWPDRGTYANETSFLTDASAAEALQFEVATRQIRRVALMTDGMQALALNYTDRTAHAPFFRPMFGAIRAGWQSGVHEQLCRDLVLLMNSKGVRSRTDDDLTLVLACRDSAEIRQ